MIQVLPLKSNVIGNTFFLLLFIFIINFSYAQTAVYGEYGKLKSMSTNAPTTASLGKFGDYPASNVYGLPEISIPIHDFSSGDLKHSISLSYHAGGRKVTERSGWVGLGWSLFAGGVITSKVNGLADLYGYFDNVLPTASFPISSIQSTIASGLVPTSTNNTADAISLAGQVLGNDMPSTTVPDYMPDYYSISAKDISGSFLFNSDWNPVLFDGTIPLKVEVIARDTVYYAAGGAIQRKARFWIYGYKVTDKDGVQYFFGGKSTSERNAVEGTWSWPDNPLPGGIGTGYGKDTYPYVSAWYLTKIKSPNDRDSIVFEYENDVTLNDVIISNSIYSLTPCTTPDFAKSIQNIETLTTKIKRIKFSNGKIEFNRSAWQSGEDTKLDNIVIYKWESNDYSQIKKVEFAYNFFINEDNTRNLKLVSVTSRGIDGSKGATFSFDYNNTPLPGRTSTDQDHWGYFNHANNPGELVKTSNVCGLCPQQSIVIPPSGNGQAGQTLTMGLANRSPNANYTQSAILTSITYPTGGKSIFEYENHKKDDNTILGGLRIKKIKTFASSSTTPSRIKEYSYSGGYTLGVADISNPDYYRIYYMDCASCVSNSFKVGTVQAVVYSNSKSTYQNESVMAYTQVSELDVNPYSLNASDYLLGSTIYTYDKEQDFAIRKFHDDTPAHFNSDWLTAPYQSMNGLRILVKEIKYYDRDNNLLKESINEYAKQSLDVITKGFQIERNNFYVPWSGLSAMSCSGTEPISITRANGNFNYTMQTYDVKKYTGFLSKTITNSYTPSGIVKDEINFFYSSNTNNSDYYTASWHPLITRSEQFRSDGNKITKIYRYPLDYTIGSQSDPIYGQLFKLKEKHIMTPIDQAEMFNDHVVKSVVTEYDGIFPLKVYSFQNSQSISAPSYLSTVPPNKIIPDELAAYMKPIIQFSYSSINARLNRQQKINNTPSVYLWGYNQEFLTAEVTNATNFEVGFESYEYPNATSDLIINGDSHTGKFCAQLGANESTGNWQKYSIRPGVYVFSAWVKSDGNGYLKMTDMYHTANSIQKQLPNTNGNWQFVSIELEVVSGANVSTTVYNSGTNSLFVDDIRFHPEKSEMTTYTYLIGFGCSSISDRNSLPISYEYDTQGRLSIVRDANRNIIKRNEYFYNR